LHANASRRAWHALAYAREKLGISVAAAMAQNQASKAGEIGIEAAS